MVKPVTNAENVDFVVETIYIMDSDSAKSPLDGRVAAFRKKFLFKGMHGFQLIAKYGREGQETLIGIIV